MPHMARQIRQDVSAWRPRCYPEKGPSAGRAAAARRSVSGAGLGFGGSGGLGACWPAWFGFGDAAEGDLEAEGAELANVVGDLPAGAGLAVVVVGAEVFMPGAGARQQRVVDLQLGVAEGDAGLVLAAAAGDLAVAGAFAGLGLAGCHGGLAGDGGQVLVAFLVPGAAGALAGLVVQRGAPGPGGQVPAGGEPAHVRPGLAEDVLGGAASPARHGLGRLEPFLVRTNPPLHHLRHPVDVAVVPAG